MDYHMIAVTVVITIIIMLIVFLIYEFTIDYHHDKALIDELLNENMELKNSNDTLKKIIISKNERFDKLVKEYRGE